MAYELLLHRARCGRYNISCSLDEDKQRNQVMLDNTRAVLRLLYCDQMLLVC